MNVLIVAAHPDDEVLGPGGSAYRWQRDGHKVENLIISQGRDDPFDQKMDTVPIVEWIGQIEQVVEKFHPEVVLTHCHQDLNRDHRVIHEATQIACRPQSGVRRLYGYEVFTSTPAPGFSPDTYVLLEQEDIDWKMTQMTSHYYEELQSAPHPRSLDGILTLARYRGMQVGHPLAEALITYRSLL